MIVPESRAGVLGSRRPFVREAVLSGRVDYVEMRLPGTVEILDLPDAEVTTEPPGLSSA